MDLGLAGKAVIVTGGANNIGRGIALGFAAEGARVLIADIDEARAKEVAAEAGGGAAAQRTDDGRPRSDQHEQERPEELGEEATPLEASLVEICGAWDLEREQRSAALRIVATRRRRWRSPLEAHARSTIRQGISAFSSMW